MMNTVKHSQGQQNSRNKEAAGDFHEHIVSDSCQGRFSQMEGMKVRRRSKRTWDQKILRKRESRFEERGEECHEDVGKGDTK